MYSIYISRDEYKMITYTISHKQNHFYGFMCLSYVSSPFFLGGVFVMCFQFFVVIYLRCVCGVPVVCSFFISVYRCLYVSM